MSDTETLQRFLDERLTSFLGSVSPRDYRRNLFGRGGLKNDAATSYTEGISSMYKTKFSPLLTVTDVGVLANDAKTTAYHIQQGLAGKSSVREELNNLSHFYRSSADNFESLFDPSSQPYFPSPADTFLQYQVAMYMRKDSYRDIGRKIYHELSDLETANQVAKRSLLIVNYILQSRQLTDEDVRIISTEAGLAANELDALCQSHFGQKRDMTKCSTLSEFYRHLAKECDSWCAENRDGGF